MQIIFKLSKLVLSDQPDEYVTVEYHVFKLEVFLMFVLVDERSLKFTFFPEVEFLHFYLLRKVYAVL